MNIIANRKVFYIFSGLLVGGGFLMFFIFGLKLGIDFTGGSLTELEFSGERPSLEDIQNRLEPLGLGQVVVQPTGERGVFIRTKDISEETHQAILRALALGRSAGQAGEKKQDAVLRELRFESIGPTIGKELKQKSVYSIFSVLGLIIAYIAWAFRRVSKPVSSWKYGVVAIVALFHDVGIPIGVFAVLGKVWGVEVDTLFITALLTVLGFSVHDTIVVFDRIRENLASAKRNELFEDVVERSIHQTFGRSLNTSLTVLLSLLAVFFFGGESVRYFSLALMLGVVFGTYSSIFIASPLLVTWHNLTKKSS